MPQIGRSFSHDLQHHPTVSLCSSSQETLLVTVKEMEAGLKVFPLVQSLFPTLLIQEAPPQTFWKHANKLLVLIKCYILYNKMVERIHTFCIASLCNNKMLHTLANTCKIHQSLMQKINLDGISQLIKFTGNTGVF